MKKAIIILQLCLLASITGFTQGNFDGIISFKVEMTGENADQMAPFMPNAYEYQFSGTNMKFLMKGGMAAAMMGEILVLGKEGTSYMIQHQAKIAYKIDTTGTADQNGEKPEVTKMDETIKIQGYDCTKYKVLASQNGIETTSYYWITDQIKVKKSKNSVGASGSVFVEGIEGFPLKMMVTTMDVTTTMTADKVEKKSFSKNDFKVPSDYEVKKFDPAMFGQ